MKRMNLSEHVFNDNDKVIVYYTVDNLIELVEKDIEEKTSIETKIHLDIFNLYSQGIYNFFIKEYDSLTETDLDNITNTYSNPDDSYSEFTDSIIVSIYEGYAASGYYEKYGQLSSKKGRLVPVCFESDKYSEFVKMLMQG